MSTNTFSHAKTVPYDRTTVHLGPEERAICQRMVRELRGLGVENPSRAIRAALHYWDTHYQREGAVFVEPAPPSQDAAVSDQQPG